MDVRRMLVGADFSPGSDCARAHAMGIAGRASAELIFAHACSIIDPRELMFAPASAALDAYRHTLADAAADDRRQLAGYVDDAHRQHIAARALRLGGFPDTALCAAAETEDADLVVIGAHGRSGFMLALLGGVADRVVRLCRRHVLIARDEMPAAGYRRILVATDFTPIATCSLEAARMLAAPAAAIEVFHAEGRPVAAITDHASAGTHDLIVLGGHGTRGLRRLLHGSVAEATARHAPTSVLIVHDRAASA